MITFNAIRANQEGWSLFQVDDRIQLQRLDDFAYTPDAISAGGPKFLSDADAIIFVSGHAASGSAYHYDAISMIGKLVEFVSVIEMTKDERDARIEELEAIEQPVEVVEAGDGGDFGMDELRELCRLRGM